MTLVLIILLIPLAYILIKLWVKFVNLIFSPFLKPKKEDRINYIKLGDFPKNYHIQNNTQENKIISIEIDSVTKQEKQFAVILNIRNLTDRAIRYKLGDVYFVSSIGRQIKGDTLRLVGMYETEDNRILPFSFIERNISFYNDLSEFSKGDMITAVIRADNNDFLLTTTFRNIDKVALS